MTIREWMKEYERIIQAAREYAGLDKYYGARVEYVDTNDDYLCIVFTDPVDQDTMTYFIEPEDLEEP